MKILPAFYLFSFSYKTLKIVLIIRLIAIKLKQNLVTS